MCKGVEAEGKDLSFSWMVTLSWPNLRIRIEVHD